MTGKGKTTGGIRLYDVAVFPQFLIFLGIPLALAIALILAVLLAAHLVRKARRKQQEKEKSATESAEGGGSDADP